MLPSASLGGRNGLYEPVHGTAPDIAGRNLANPIAMIASTAMMFKYSFGLEREAAAIETAIASVLDEGYRTADLMAAGGRSVGTREMGRLILARLDAQAIDG